MKTLTTTNKYEVFLDDQDYEWASLSRWFYENTDTHQRVYSSKVKGRSALHRLILSAPPEMDVHHEDGNPLNNQRGNLTLIPKTVHGYYHMLESGPRRGCGDGRFKGICQVRGRWRASIRHEGRQIILGSHPTAEEAALVYDAAVLHYRDGRGYLNLLNPQ